MLRICHCIFLGLIVINGAIGQTSNSNLGCGTQSKNLIVEDKASYVEWTSSQSTYSSGLVKYTLPIIVHVVHDGAIGNISDAQVYQAIEYLNDAFRNRNMYDPNTGVDTEIEFCLAQRDTSGNAINGLIRHNSPLTDMSLPGSSYANLAQTATFNTDQYINIRIVDVACNGTANCNLAGFAINARPDRQDYNGIVIDNEYFGTNSSKSTTLIHEMGHYLGLLHTFAGGCKNDNCLVDGDRVCDTPPDGTNTIVYCGFDINSCTSDDDDVSMNNPFRPAFLGGLGDVADDKHNYMDYNDRVCRSSFTSGQALRMEWFILNYFTPLLSSKSCLPPCDIPVEADFICMDNEMEVGQSQELINASAGNGEYEWYVNETLASNNADYEFFQNISGTYFIKLVVLAQDSLCYADSIEKIINVSCPPYLDFDYHYENENIVFQISDINSPYSFYWEVTNENNDIILTSNNALDSIDYTNQDFLEICLNLEYLGCENKVCAPLVLSEGTEICGNELDDDNDGFVDSFDEDCECTNESFNDFCPLECQSVPDSFPKIELSLKWKSPDIGIKNTGSFVIGDIDNDGNVEIVSKKNTGTASLFNEHKNYLSILNGEDGSLFQEIAYTDSLVLKESGSPLLSIDADRDSYAEFYFADRDTIYKFNHLLDLIWKTSKPSNSLTIGAADFNLDGIPEIYLSNIIINSITGQILVQDTLLKGCNSFSPSNIFNTVDDNVCIISASAVADLLSTPGLELASGDVVYEVVLNNLNGEAGNELIPHYPNSPEVKDGVTSLGDIDGDGALDVVVVRNKFYESGGGIYIWNPRTGDLIAKGIAGGDGGIAMIADVDNDCIPEIGAVFTNEILIYKYNGTEDLEILYSKEIQDKSGRTGLSIFDINQDGRQELLHCDEEYFRIFDAQTGVIIDSIRMLSNTLLEVPIIVDIDNDNQAEILVSGSETEDGQVAIYCYESATEPWAPARSVWNQINYHVTNINDDLTVPRYPQNHAAFFDTDSCSRITCPQPYNNHNVQATYRTQKGCIQWPEVDLALEILDYQCGDDSLCFDVLIHNLGEKQIAIDSLSLACYVYYPVNPNSAAPMEVTSLGIKKNTITGYSEFSDTFRICSPIPDSTLPNGSDLEKIYFIINDYGFGQYHTPIGEFEIKECHYENNVDSIMVNIEKPVLDLGPDIEKCESEVITLNVGAGFESYIWSDYSTDSLYSTSNDGLHFVEATDQCGRVYRDTVEFIFSEIQEINLGEDTLFCPNSPLELSLSESYESILWLPSSAVDCDTCTQVSIQIEEPTTITALGQNGTCISIDSIHLNFVPQISITEIVEVCEGDTYVYLDSSLIQTGIYTFLLNNCDSILNIDFRINLRDTTALNQSICESDSFYFNDIWLKDEGTYYDTLLNGKGCDSLVALELFVADEILNIDTISICEGDSTFVFDTWIYTSVELSQMYVANSGCDSIQTFQIISNPLPHISQSFYICPHDSIFIGDQWLKESGMYEIRLASLTDCDTILDVTLIHLETPTSRDTILFCEGDSIFISDAFHSETTEVIQILQSEEGCDSTQITSLIMIPHLSTTDTFSICEGDSIFLYDTWIFDQGIYQDTLEHDDCFSISTTLVNEYQDSDTIIYVDLCPGDSIYFGNQWRYSSGEYIETEVNSQGCDSLKTMYLTYLEEPLPPSIDIDCDVPEIILYIDVQDNWNVLWDNGDTSKITTYFHSEEAHLTLSTNINCERSFTLALPTLPTINIALNDTVVMPNTVIPININLSSEEWNIYWTTNATIDCDTCFNVNLKVEEQSTVEIDFIHISGCEYFSSFDIDILKENNNEIPNIFSPNGDGINDTWEYHLEDGNSSAVIKIYDRWGNLLFENRGNSIIWDGMSEGKIVNPGVYIYYIEFITQDSQIFKKVGDITIIH